MSAGTYTAAFTAPSGYVLETAEASVTTPGPGSTVLVGAYQPSSISETVFVDANNDGVQDFGESGLAGVTVTLQGTSDSTETNSSGAYSFSGLAAGTYTVQFAAPSGYVMAGSSSDSSSSVSLTSGDEETLNAPAYSSSATASISGMVYLDYEGEYTDDPIDPGVAGATVSLTQSGNPAVNASATTTSNGGFEFSDLSEGTYTLSFTSSSGYVMETSDLTVSTPCSTVAVGAYQPNSISGTAFVDVNNDLTDDSGDPAVAGVSVAMVDQNGNTYGPVTTAANGSYSFNSLAPGSYTLTFTAPSGYLLSGNSATSSTTVDVLTNYAQTQDIPVYESTGGTSVSGTVFVDSNGDSSDDSGDPGLAGVTVTLLDQNGNPATDLTGGTVSSTTTTSSGSFSFGNLPDGTYTALFSDPPTGNVLRGRRK